MTGLCQAYFYPIFQEATFKASSLLEFSQNLKKSLRFFFAKSVALINLSFLLKVGLRFFGRGLDSFGQKPKN